MKRTASFFVAALSLGLAVPAFAGDPVPGVDISLSQSPGGRIASAATDATGTVSFLNVPEGRYQVLVGNCKLTAPAILTITSGRDSPIVSDPVPVDRTPCGTTSSRGYATGKGGGALTLIIPASTGTAREAKLRAVSGAAPREAKSSSLPEVVITLRKDSGSD